MLKEFIIYLFFISYLAAPRPTFGYFQGGSITNSMLITAFDTYLIPRSPGASLPQSPTEHLVQVWTKILPILNNPLDFSCSFLEKKNSLNICSFSHLNSSMHTHANIKN